MSIAIMTKVWGTELGSPTVKSVAMKLADCAHDNGRKVYPSIKHVARHSEVSERSAQYAIKELRRLKVLKVETQGGGVSTTVYAFDLEVLDRLYKATQAKWAKEDEEIAKRTGAKSAPVKVVLPPGASLAPKPSVNQEHKTKNKQPVQFVEGGGDQLIPFDETDDSPAEPTFPVNYTTEAVDKGANPNAVGSCLQAAMSLGSVQAARAKLPTHLAEQWRLPFTPRTIAKIRMMGVDPQSLAEKYLEKTKGQKIKSPCAYLVRMAQEVAAERQGISVDMVAALAGADRAKKAAILAAEVGCGAPITEQQLRAKASQARTANGAALIAALGRGRAA